MSGKVAEVYAQVDWRFDQVKLRDVAKYIGDLNVSSIISAGSVAALGVGLKDLIDQTAGVANNLNILATTTGVNPQFIQKIEHAAYVLGSSKSAADSWISSLSSLQQKLMMAQGDQRFFTAAQMLGVDPISFQKIIGNTEDLAMAVKKILAAPNDATDRNTYERIQRTKTWLASMVSVSPDLLTAFQHPDFDKQYNDFKGLSNSEIQQNITSTEAWREVVDKVNVEFQEMATHTLPILTAAVKDFTDNGGLKGILDLIKAVSEDIYKIELIGGIGSNFIKKAFINASTSEQAAKNDEMKEMQREKNITITTGSITVHAKDSADFGKKFQDEFTKALDQAARQSTLGQT